MKKNHVFRVKKHLYSEIYLQSIILLLKKKIKVLSTLLLFFKVLLDNILNKTSLSLGVCSFILQVQSLPLSMSQVKLA